MDNTLGTVAARRDSDLKINLIYLCDIWGLNVTSPRLVIRSSINVNDFCLVSILSGEITYGPCDANKLKDYMDGNNKWGAKFKYFGRMEDLMQEKYGSLGFISNMAYLVVFKGNK